MEWMDEIEEVCVVKGEWKRLGHQVGRSALVFLILLSCACGSSGEMDWSEEESEALYLSLEGIRSSFDKNYVMSDDVFNGDLYGMDEAAVQAFLEETPYGTRSWLADYSVNGQPFSRVLVEESSKHGVNPAVMLVRLQCEQSMVSKRPSQRKIDEAFGCGCHDGQACRPEFLGLDNQIECAARHLRLHYQWSETREPERYQRGSTRQTFDGPVTPDNHATAAHYNYTPHIGSANQVKGAYLTWLVAKKYLDHIATQNPQGTAQSAWVGDRCDSSDQCHSEGSCREADGGGMCVMSCDGRCPDRPGKATTFCVSLDGGQTGTCVARAERSNNFCQSMPNATRQMASRFVRTSGAQVIDREVCLPNPVTSPQPDPVQPDPVQPDPVQPDPIDSGDESTDTFVGSPCAQDGQCNFVEGNEMGMCIAPQTVGTCALSCEGHCPDRDGFPTTFCVSLDHGQSGVCVPRASDANDNCEDRPDMIRVEMPRHVGSSGASSASRVVCVPYLPASG